MDKLKVLVIIAITAMWNGMGILAFPVIILVGCNIIDYVTGLIASPYRQQDINSYRSIRGIAKKICMWLLVVVGWFLDLLIQQSVLQIGLDWHVPNIVATLVAVWLTTNEMISILENMVDIGVSIPPFLMPLIKYIRKSTDQKIDIPEESEEDDE